MKNIQKCVDNSKLTLYILNQEEVALLWNCSIVLCCGQYYKNKKSTKVSWEVAYRGKEFNPKGTYAFLTQVKEIQALGKDDVIFYSGAIHSKNKESYVILGAGVHECKELSSDKCVVFDESKIEELLEVKQNFLNDSHGHHGSRGTYLAFGTAGIYRINEKTGSSMAQYASKKGKEGTDEYKSALSLLETHLILDSQCMGRLSSRQL